MSRRRLEGISCPVCSKLVLPLDESGCMLDGYEMTPCRHLMGMAIDGGWRQYAKPSNGSRPDLRPGTSRAATPEPVARDAATVGMPDALRRAGAREGRRLAAGPRAAGGRVANIECSLYCHVCGP